MSVGIQEDRATHNQILHNVIITLSGQLFSFSNIFIFITLFGSKKALSNKIMGNITKTDIDGTFYSIWVSSTLQVKAQNAQMILKTIEKWHD